MKIYAGPERQFEDFQNKAKRFKRQLYQEDYTIYIAETGLLTPPEINFYYNPALTTLQNLEEYEQSMHKYNPHQMFKNCNVFERWCYNFSTKTNQAWRIPIRLLLEMPNTSRYDLSFLNYYITGNEDYVDIDLTVNDYYEQGLHRNIELNHLLTLSRKIYFEKIPQLVKEINESAIKIEDIDKIHKRMDALGIIHNHIGVVATNTTLPHIKEMIIEHMIGEAISKILTFGFVERHFDPFAQVAKIKVDVKKGEQGNKDLEQSAQNPGSQIGDGSQLQSPLLPKAARKKALDLSRRTSMKGDEMQRMYVVDFLRQIYQRTEYGIKVWETMIKPQVMYDFHFYLLDEHLQYLNYTNIFFTVEKTFHFIFEANTENLKDLTQANIEAFFKNTSAPFSWLPYSVSLQFGDGIIEDYMNEAEFNSEVSLNKKIILANDALRATDYRTDLYNDDIVHSHLRYIDYLMQRGSPEDLTEADRILGRLIENKIRKDNFEHVSYPSNRSAML